jgi:hypothetical protein
MTGRTHSRRLNEKAGRVVVSVDAELAWGFHDLFPLSAERNRRMAKARENWKTLIGLFDRYDIPATWAVVGELLPGDTDRYRERHPLGTEWFETVREHSAHHPDWWSGTELVTAIETTDIDHEIGSHSYSHVVFSDVSGEVALAESQFSRQIGADNGLELTSFVFPRNEIAHRRALSETGFTCYRGTRPRTTPQMAGLQGAAMVWGYFTGTTQPPLVEPTIDEHGLVNVPASMYLGGLRARPWSTLAAAHTDPGVRLARLGIDCACAEQKLFHLWLHPNDLTERRYIERLRDVFSYIDAKRREEGLRIETMGEIAARVSE